MEHPALHGDALPDLHGQHHPLFRRTDRPGVDVYAVRWGLHTDCRGLSADLFSDLAGAVSFL